MTGLGGGGREVLSGLHLAWVREEDLPPDTRWLSDAEREVLKGLKLDKRRTDWLLGRWAVRRALASCLAGDTAVGADVWAGDGLGDVSVLADDDGRPRILGPAEVLGHTPPAVSLSHSGGLGFSAVGPGPTALGCDVEVVAPRSDAFVEDYFTAFEAQAVALEAPSRRAVAANLIWSAKESALKALGEGLRLDTRSVQVDVAGLAAVDKAWIPLAVTGPGERVFRGHWRVADGFVWTVLTGAD